MNKFSVFSLASLLIFISLFVLMFSGVPLGGTGRIVLISLYLFPLLGIIFGSKGRKGFMKWLLIIANIIAFCAIGYLGILAISISES